MLHFLILVFFVEYGHCCIETFPTLPGAIHHCSNQTNTCQVSCPQGRIFYDGNITKEYKCTEDGLWSPSVPGQGCLGRIDATFWLRFEVNYKTTGIAFFCLQSHERTLIDNSELFKSQVSHFCNNQLITVGDISIDSMKSTTSSLTITSIFHFQIGDSSTTLANKRACQSVLIANAASSNMFVYGNTLQCNTSSVSINRTSVEVNPDVSTCPVHHVLVSDPTNNDYCVLNQPVVGAQLFQFTVNITQDITIHCEIVFGKEINDVDWQHNSKKLTILTDNKYNGSTSTHPSLFLRNVSYDDAGNYICRARNSFEIGQSPEIVLSVIPRPDDIPKITTVKTQYEVIAGQDITLECIVIAYPVAYAVEWVRNVSGVSKKIDSSVVYIGGNISMPSITLVDVDLKEAGHYKCTATNIAGTGTSSSIQLTVKGDVPAIQVQENHEIILGKNATLNCSYTSLPEVFSVTWQFNRSGVLTNISVDGLKYDGSTIKTPSLTIANVSFNDAGTYFCLVTNFLGVGTSLPVKFIVVGDSPVVSIGSPLYSVIIGDNITIDCHVSGDPSALFVTWFRNATQVSVLEHVIGERYSGGSLVTPSLNINHVQNGDEGWYICSATNLAGTTYSENVFINITGAEPRVTIPSAEYNVIFGKTITLECTILAHPPVISVQWQIKNKDGTSDIEVGNDIHFFGASIDSPSLQLEQANFTHEGTYRCTATNQVGLGVSNFSELNVIGDKPMIKLQSTQYDVIITTNTTIACNVTSVPDLLEVTWKMQHPNSSAIISIDGNKYIGGTVDDNALTISNLASTDSGVYVCSARNLIGISESGDIMLNVTGGIPIVLTQTESYLAILGDDITLECSVKSHPLPTNISWVHTAINGISKEVDLSSSHYTFGKYPFPSLKILSVMFSDEGEYHCIVRNLVGERENVTALSVKGDPPNVTANTIHYNVLEDDNVTMHCNVSGIPAVQSVRWRMNTTAFVRSGLIGGNLSHPSLTLQVARLEDTGWYICTAENLAGTSEGQLVYLNVSEKCIKYLPVVPNSDVECSYGDGAGSCSVSCVSQYIFKDGTSNKQYSCTGRNDWSPSLPVSTCLETAPSTYVIKIQITYKTSFFAFYCKDAHEKAIARSIDELTRQIDYYCNNQFVAVGPIVINSTTTTTSSFDIYTLYDVIIGNSATLKENKEACNSILGIKVGDSAFLDYGNNLQCNATASTVTKHGGVIVNRTVLCPDKFTVIPDSHTCVSQIPIVETNQTEFTAQEGDTITFSCDIKSDLLITNVFWQFTPFGTSGRTLISMGEVRFYGGTPDNPGLSIADVSHADIGSFRCSASNSAGDGHGPDIALAVVTSTKDLPQVKIQRLNYDVVLGDNVTLECSVMSKLLVTKVMWLKIQADGLNEVIIDGVSFTGSSPSRPDLVIIEATFEQAGDYKCAATNFAGTQISNMTTIKVTGDKPRVTTPSTFYTVQFGHNVTFYCSIAAVPAITNVSWLHNTTDRASVVTIDNNKYFSSIENPSLRIITATSEDIGWYICVGVNLAGETHSQPIYFNVSASLPVVSTPLVIYGVVAGDSITLKCQIFSYPSLLNTTWEKYTDKASGFVRITANSKFILGDIKNPSLTINNVHLNESGEYVCGGTNDVGTSYGSPITLSVKGGPPEINLPSTYSVLFGNNVTLQSSISAVPNITSVTWFKTTSTGDVVIDITLDKFIGGTLEDPSLTLSFVTYLDEGEYTCRGTNKIGSNSKKTSLIIEGGVPSAEVMSTLYHGEIGANVTMHCNISGRPEVIAVVWKTNTTSLSVNQHTGGTLEKPNLTIYNVRLADAGWYICTASNIVGTGSSHPVYLNVTGEEVCKDEYFPRISNAATLCIESTELFCTVTCNNEHVTRDGNTTVYFKCSNNEWLPKLPPKGCIEYINPYTAYIVTATYRLNFNASYCLSGIESRLNSLKPVFVQQAMSACNNNVFSVGTMDLSNIQFSTANRLVYSEYTLRITENLISSSDRAYCKIAVEYKAEEIFTVGGYVNCGYANSTIETNAVEFKTSDDVCPNSTSTVKTSAETFCVFDVPSVVAGRPSYTAENGNMFILECNVESNAVILNVYWVINVTGQFQTFFGNDTSGRYQGSTPKNPSLTIVNVDFADIGYYICHASNNIGKGSSLAIHLNVIKRVRALPVITSAYTNLQYKVGDTAEISCSIDKKSEPSAVYWQFSSDSSSAIYQPFTFNNRFSGSTGQMPSLRIQNLQEDDTGYYTCYAVNVLGVGKGDPVRVVVRKLEQGPNDPTVGESKSGSDELSCVQTFGYLLVFAAVGIVILNITCIMSYNLFPSTKSSLIRNIKQWRISEKIVVITAEVLLSVLTACAVVGIISVVTCTNNMTGATLGITASAIIPGMILALCYLALCGYIQTKRFTRVNDKNDDSGLIPSGSEGPDEHAKMKSWRHYRAGLSGTEHQELEKGEIEVPNNAEPEVYASTFKKPPDLYASTFKNEPLISNPSRSLTPGRHAHSLPPIGYSQNKEERRKRRRKKKKRKREETFDTMHDSDG